MDESEQKAMIEAARVHLYKRVDDFLAKQAQYLKEDPSVYANIENEHFELWFIESY